MAIQDLVDYFIKNPKQLKRSAGKFVRGERGGSVFNGTTVEEVNEAKVEARMQLDGGTALNFLQVVSELPIPQYSVTTTNSNVSYTVKVDNENGKMTSEVECDFEPKSDLELAELHKIDLTKYKICTFCSQSCPF